MRWTQERWVPPLQWLLLLEAGLHCGVSSSGLQHHESTSTQTIHSQHPAQLLLHPRIAHFPHFLNEDWIFDFHEFTCLLPLSTAAAQLQDFYENVAGFAAIVPASTAHFYHMFLGEITLEVRTPAGHQIPWPVVQSFANYMLDMTKRGFSLWVGYVRALEGPPG